MIQEIPQKLQKDPNFVRYYVKWQADERSMVFIPLAEMLRQHGLLEHAFEVCQKGLAYHPGMVSGRIQLAHILIDQGKRAEAEMIAQAILRDVPENEDVHKVLERLNVTQKPDPFHTVTMARIFLKQGNEGQAKRILESILVREPQNQEARDMLLSSNL